MKLKDFLNHVVNFDNEIVVEECDEIIAQGCPAALRLTLPEERLNQTFGLVWGVRTVTSVYNNQEKAAIVVSILPKQ